MPYLLHELFQTLQGEGRNTGRPCLFIRFSGCNLSCPWCDTDFSPKMTLTLEELLARIESFSLKSIILTGGEPLLQAELELLVLALKSRGYWIAIETNGTIDPSPTLSRELDYIATSPKLNAPLKLKRANEVRLVVTTECTAAWCEAVRANISAEDYYLSPCDEHGVLHLRETIELLGELNATAHNSPWRLSIQTHKLAGIP
ncbi:MAG: 7-carboxy-7-deazaguanine synthase QueE [Kiritimatiellia bacterium]